MLADIQSYIRTTVSRQRDLVRVGPFLATFDRHSTSPYLSYALPDTDAVPDLEDVRALVQVFTDRGRTPRLEYLPDIAPRVEPALVAAGFREELRTTVMTLGPDGPASCPYPDGFDIRPATSDIDLADMLRTQFEAFGGDPAAVGADDVAQARVEVLAVVARDAGSGLIAGTAAATTVVNGVSELAGVAVREPYRGRGIAATLTARLTEVLRDAGAAVLFISPGTDAAARVYHRVGYRPVGEMLHLSRP